MRLKGTPTDKNIDMFRQPSKPRSNKLLGIKVRWTGIHKKTIPTSYSGEAKYGMMEAVAFAETRVMRILIEQQDDPSYPSASSLEPDELAALSLFNELLGQAAIAVQSGEYASSLKTGCLPSFAANIYVNSKNKKFDKLARDTGGMDLAVMPEVYRKIYFINRDISRGLSGTTAKKSERAMAVLVQHQDAFKGLVASPSFEKFAEETIGRSNQAGTAMDRR